MAQAKKIEILTVELEPKPGALANVYAAFRENGISTIASWAYQMGPDKATGHFYVTDPTKARDVLAKLGKPAKTEQAGWVEDVDQLGRYHDILAKIAKAGVNIEATDAFAINGKFACVIFVNQNDVERLAQALGAS